MKNAHSGRFSFALEKKAKLSARTRTPERDPSQQAWERGGAQSLVSDDEPGLAGEKCNHVPSLAALMVGGRETTTHQVNKGFFGGAKLAT